VATDPAREWSLGTLWTTQDWGSPAPTRARPWPAPATGNFCGPQFHGMWRDVAWHRRLTRIIHEAKLPAFSRPCAKAFAGHRAQP
jgi:hypothetical protein